VSARPAAAVIGRAGPAEATLGQRLRARAVAALAGLVAILPGGIVEALGDALGELWYRFDRRRARLGRRNLERVVRYLVSNGMASPRLATAATDGAALDRLLRATFRHAVHYYLELARLPRLGAAEVDRLLMVETPESVARAFGPDAPSILVGMHFGAIELPGRFAAAKTSRPIVAPMETLADPALQAWVRRTRALTGIEIVGLRDARRALLAALRAGRTVGIIADRRVAGGAAQIAFFGAPAPMPLGPALVAVETGRPIYLGAVRRIGGGRYAGRLDPVPVATEGDRRARVMATMEHVARAMEAAIAVAPEQWWSLLSPLWPDIDPRAATGTGRLEAASAAEDAPAPGEEEAA
jgi:lauroyl/myristoyl acyltransferase